MADGGIDQRESGRKTNDFLRNTRESQNSVRNSFRQSGGESSETQPLKKRTKKSDRLDP